MKHIAIATILALAACGNDATDDAQPAPAPIKLQGGDYSGIARYTAETCGLYTLGSSEPVTMFVFDGYPAEFDCSTIDGRIECVEYYPPTQTACAYSGEMELRLTAASEVEVSGTVTMWFRSATCGDCIIEQTVMLTRD